MRNTTQRGGPSGGRLATEEVVITRGLGVKEVRLSASMWGQDCWQNSLRRRTPRTGPRENENYVRRVPNAAAWPISIDAYATSGITPPW